MRPDNEQLLVVLIMLHSALHAIICVSSWVIQNCLLTRKAHRKVREELVLKNSKTANQLAKLLLEVHRERKRADYDDEYAAAKKYINCYTASGAHT